MKKTNKPNPLKTFNDNKAMAYKKAGGEMATFKKYLTKAQNGISVNSGMDSISKKNNSTMSDYNSNVDTINKDIVKRAIEGAKGNPNNTRPYKPYSGSRGTQLESYGIEPGIRNKPMTPQVNYRDEIQKKYGTGKSNLTPEDIIKLKDTGVYKKGGTVKRKK